MTVSCPVCPSGFRKSIKAVLSAPTMRRVNFEYRPIMVESGSYVVNATSLARVARLVEDGQIALRHETNPNYGGSYQPGIDRLNLRPGNAPTIVHECVHALGDVLRLKIHRFEFEAVAYLADATYGVASILNRQASGIRGSRHVSLGRAIAQWRSIHGTFMYESISASAIPVIEKFRLGERADRQVLTVDDLKPIEEALRSNATYVALDNDELLRLDGV
jgi:hypothetical protein